MTVKIAHIMGLGESELIHIRRGALLHDIGKMGIPDNILLKPGSTSGYPDHGLHPCPMGIAQPEQQRGIEICNNFIDLIDSLKPKPD